MRSAFRKLRERWERNEVSLFPFLAGLALLYVSLIVAFSPDQLKNDEFRYFGGANNLTKGFFVPSDQPDFTNGPGYPLLLAPVLTLLGFEFDELIQDPESYEYLVPGPDGEASANLKWRLLPLRLLNAFFLTAGLFFISRFARFFVSQKTTLLIVLAIGLNPFQLRWIHVMMTESTTPFLFGGFAWAYTKALRSESFSWKWILLAGLFFGWLALTRTIFGYVATAAIALVPLYCLADGKRQLVWRAVGPMVAALIFCLPYLAYTHHHTGKVFCWGTNGGELLYWITSPHDGEFGNWQQEKWLVADPVMAGRHLEFVRHVSSLPPLERNATWMEGVRQNLSSERSRKALVRNYFANFCRAFFGAPLTRQYQEFPKLVWTLTGACFLGAALLAVLPSILCWGRIPVELKLTLLIALIYFGGAVLLPTGPRYWIPILPAVAVWIAFVFENLVVVTVSLRPQESGRPGPGLLGTTE